MSIEPLRSGPPEPAADGGRRAVLPLAVTTLGVVFGDIGTSPLYALRECFFGTHAVAPTPGNVLGVLSLIIYALVVVISLKYVVLVMRADNQGEGGILALAALVPPRGGAEGAGASRLSPGRPVLVALGIFGTALLYGDGMITPAISVLGAVEGLEVAMPVVSGFVVPIAVAILVALFAIQKYGTHRVGGLFGPVVILWFVVIGGLGLVWIARAPAVLAALDPRHAVAFFGANGLAGFAVLGAVFLVVTGGEALYADMGHFGARPIRLAWFGLVLPALLLNYLGQGALLLGDATAAQPFFLLAPAWARLPLVGLATAAAIIASQALISGSFSITRQAVQLGLAPRVDVTHTSAREEGQIYVPWVNWGLMAATVAVVLTFRSSGALAAAYGIAVTLTMVITVLLLHVVMTERWGWPRPAALALTAGLLAVDVAFLAANALKLPQGGWVTVVVAAALFTLMTTWRTGRRLLGQRLSARTVPLPAFVAGVADAPPMRVAGTAVFMTAQPGGAPPALVHNLEHNKVLHARVAVLTVATADTPYVGAGDRVSARELGQGVVDLRMRFGFMETPDVPAALRRARDVGLDLPLDDVTYFLGRETIVVTRRQGMALWRERLFVLMSRAAARANAFFRLPPRQVVEIGVQVEL